MKVSMYGVLLLIEELIALMSQQQHVKPALKNGR
jgi:hypothetical protein